MRYVLRSICMMGWLLLLCSAPCQAATELVTPFVCGFEQDEDLSDWTLNPQTADARDQWVVGSATHSQGERSLYISMNQGYTAAFGRQPNTVYAYRTFRYPQSAVTKRYDISFDWRCFGNPDKAKLRVWYGRKELMQTALLKYASSNNGKTIPTDQLNVCEEVTTGEVTSQELYNSEAWQSATLATKKVPVNMVDTEFVLLFIWTNECHDNDSILRVGACIDNIQIVSADAPRPSHVTADIHCADSSMLVRWESSLSHFMIAYRGNQDNGWSTISGIDETVAQRGLELEWSYRIPYVDEGIYELKLWAIKDYSNTTHRDTSACVYLKDIISYCADNHCIDYVHLHASNVTCTYGTYQDPYAHTGVLDYGSHEKESRHTIQSEMNQFDPRTNNQLRTIPVGALASVRLGNWNNNFEAESITYEYEVDSIDNAILLLKYAIVLEDPEHKMEDQPFFSLRVKNAEGQLIDDGFCSMVEYYAGHGAGVWNSCTWFEHMANGSVEGHPMLWKDWSTVGLNLKKLHGQKVYVELLSKDCNQGMHFGYAYFTLDCVSSKIQTNNCAEGATAEATAPEGFYYEWRRVANDSVVSHEQRVVVDASDESAYTCRCTFQENADCSFLLRTVLKPQYPVAEFQPLFSYHDCEVNLQLRNDSWIKYYEDGLILRADQRPQNYDWDIRTASGQHLSTTALAPWLRLSNMGDTVYIQQTAYLAQMACSNTRIDTLYVPAIRQPDSVRVEHACRGTAVWFDGQLCDTSGLYEVRTLNQYGCDSVMQLYLTLHNASPDTTIHDTICSSAPYIFGGDTLTHSGEYTIHPLNQWGCDSTVHLYLQMARQMEVQVDPLPAVCADDGNLPIHYHFSQGQAASLQIRFDSAAHANQFEDRTFTNLHGTTYYPLSGNTRVGRYVLTLTFEQDATCENRSFTLPFEVHYASSILEQKWNDVLAIHNARYNGGYQFTQYRWYRNGELLPNQHGSYIYLTDELEMETEYYVELTQPNGLTMTSCPITTHRHSDIAQFPTIVQSGAPMRAYLPAQALLIIYRTDGTRMQSLTADMGWNELTAPSPAGIYIVQITYADERTETRKIIIP